MHINLLTKQIPYNKQLTLFNNSDLFNLNILKLNLFSFIRKNCVTGMDKYINQIIPQQKHLLSIIRPNKINLSVNICHQSSLIRYMSHKIGYEINEYLLFIGINEDGKIVYDKKYLFRELNIRKIIHNLLSNDAKYVLISQNMINRKIKRNANRYSQELFDEKFINDLEDILNISNIQIINHSVIIKKKVFFYRKQIILDETMF